MGGMRAAGDLVARMQMTRRMRLKEAKRYVADKLGVTPRDLSDPVAMETVRLEKGLGTLAFTSSVHPDEPGMIEAKFNIAELLDIPINCVERFKEARTGCQGAREGREARTCSTQRPGRSGDRAGVDAAASITRSPASPRSARLGRACRRT